MDFFDDSSDIRQRVVVIQSRQAVWCNTIDIGLCLLLDRWIHSHQEEKALQCWYRLYETSQRKSLYEMEIPNSIAATDKERCTAPFDVLLCLLIDGLSIFGMKVLWGKWFDMVTSYLKNTVFRIRNAQQILLTICVFAQSKGTHSILLISRPTSFARRLKCAPGNQSGMNRTIKEMVSHPFVNIWENTYESERTLPNIFRERRSMPSNETIYPEDGREGRHLKLFGIRKQPSI